MKENQDLCTFSWRVRNESHDETIMGIHPKLQGHSSPESPFEVDAAVTRALSLSNPSLICRQLVRESQLDPSASYASPSNICIC